MKSLSVNIALFLAALLTFFAGSSKSPAKDCVPDKNYELIRNGDFEQGDTLFYTEYINAPDYMRPCKTYAVSYNPKDNYAKFDSCGDHTTGTGKMLVVNGDTVHGSVVWRQTVRNISPGTDYDFSFWFTPVNSLKPAILIIVINGDTLSPWPVWMPDSTCLWSQAKYVWNSGSSDTAEISIYDINLSYFGNDFALDDISLMPYCRLQACAGQSVSTCRNFPVTLDGNAMDGFKPYRFKWAPATGLNNPNIKNPVAQISSTTTYILEVSDARNCTAYDTITVTVYDEPNSTILASPQSPSCPCEPVTLTAAVEDYDYLWSTGDTTRSITVNEPGTYTLEVSDENGCKSTGNYELLHKPVSVTVSLDSINDGTGKELQFYFHMTDDENLTGCGYTSYTAKISYNASMLIPRKDTPFGTVANGIETITVSGDLANAGAEPLNFYTLWGNSECTDLSIDEISFSCDSVNTKTIPGRFCLTDLCDAGGLRLFGSGQTAVMSITNLNNTLDVKLNLTQDSFVNLALYSYTGEQVAVLFKSGMNTGKHKLSYDLNNLSKGIYFLVLNTGTSRQTAPVPVY